MSLVDSDGWTEATDAQLEAERRERAAEDPHVDALVNLEVARRLLRDRMARARRAAALLAKAQLVALAAREGLDEAVETCVLAMRALASEQSDVEAT